MSTWGIGIYDDDVSYEVREYYENALKSGMTSREAEDSTINYFHNEVLNPEDAPVFWFALSDIQWNYGRLSELVKNNALKYIDSGQDLKKWCNEGTNAYQQREKVLEKLKIKLLSPQPPERKIRKPTVFICSWKIGDVFAYQLQSDFAKQNDMLGYWAILQKVNQADNMKNGLSPVITVRIIKSAELPNLDTLSTPCVRISRYLGYKWSYRLHLLLYSKRSMSKFVFLGNTAPVLAADDYSHPTNCGYFSCLFRYFEESIIDALNENGTE